MTQRMAKVLRLILVIALVPITTAAQVTTTSDTFVDDDGNPHERAIEAIATAGITLGCSIEPPRYCPDQTVTRAEMASFLARAFGLEASTTDWFLDDDASPHENAINAVAEAGITLGYADGTYRPTASVRRDEMATFIVRAASLEPTQNDWYSDDGGPHQANINSLADAGVTFGYGDGTYRPDSSVTRDEMASFLARTLGLIDRPAPGSLDWTIEAGADSSQLALIVSGFDLADKALDRIGGSISDDLLSSVAVSIQTTGERSGCCDVRRFGDTVVITIHLSHPDWANTADPLLWTKIAAHEYVHAWQATLDCIATEVFLYPWLSEGSAEWVGWHALVDAGITTDIEADNAGLVGADWDGTLHRPLSEFEGLNGYPDTWPGYIGYLAVDRLLTNVGPSSLRTVCAVTAETNDRHVGFETAFGTTTEAFYADFATWTASLP